MVRPDVYHREQADKLVRWSREARSEAHQLRERASALEASASRDAAEARVHRIAAASLERGL
jgi:BMFP domain-containing protein YqiC